MIDEIVDYLEELYELTDVDLTLEDQDRYMLLGQRAMIDEIKKLRDNGIPLKDETDD